MQSTHPALTIAKKVAHFKEWHNEVTPSFRGIRKNIKDIPSFFDSYYKNNHFLNAYLSQGDEIEMYNKICAEHIFSFTNIQKLKANFLNNQYISSSDLSGESAYQELVGNILPSLYSFNSTAVIGLYHLFEKGCKNLMYHELNSLYFREYHLYTYDKTVERWDLWLKIFFDINIFKQFPLIERLKLTTNYLKHGIGPSYDKLRERFPEVFSLNEPSSNDSSLYCLPLAISDASAPQEVNVDTSLDTSFIIQFDYANTVEEILSFWRYIHEY